ncbi:uncharacterized protein LOC114726968 [Neltuma alba]|uniref:uncharacterized protein LOC114726968 n=1 Tax=Neltuma alba TaxID=207710 RepID=UPI0010A39C56|nr:uncharacterized protein LOC114726968 [Prosopis alba]
MSLELQRNGYFLLINCYPVLINLLLEGRWSKVKTPENGRCCLVGFTGSAILSSTSLPYEAQQKVHSITTIVERELFNHAASEDEYKNQETLAQRMQNQLQGTIFSPQVNSYNTSTPMKGPSSELSHAWYNRNQADPVLQMLAASDINFTDFSKANVDNTNKYEFSNGRQSHASVGNERTFPYNDFSSFLRSVDPDGFSNSNAPGGTSSLNSSFKSIFSHLQHQQRDHVEKDWSKYDGNQSSPFVITMRESPLSMHGNLMISPFVRTEASQAFSNFTVQNPCCQYSSVNNLMQYQPQNLHSQQNFQHFESSYEQGANAYIAKSRPCFASKHEPCSQLQGQKILNQSQLPSTPMNVGQQFFSASSACLYGSNRAAGVALRHFDECRSDDYRSSDSSNIMTMDSTVRGHDNLEGISPPSKRLKIEATFDVSVSNSDIYKLWDSQMVLNNSPERLPKMPQQPESFFPIYSKVTDNNMESSTNAKQDSANFSMTDNNVIGIEAILFESREASHKLRDSYPKSNDEVARNIGENDSGSNSNSSKHTFKKDPSVDIGGVQERGGFDQAGKKTTKEVIGPKADLEKAMEFSNQKIMTVSGGVFGQNFDNETLSQGPEVDGVLEKSYLESNGLIARSSMDTVRGSSLSVQAFQKDSCADMEGVQGRVGFDQAGKKTTEEVIEPKAHLEQGTVSSKANPVISGVSYDVLEKTYKSGTTSEGIEGGNTLEDSYLNIDDVKLTVSNAPSDVGKSNSSERTLQKDPIADVDDFWCQNEFNQSVKNNANGITEPKYDLENGEKSSKPTLSSVSLTETFTYDQIKEHIMSLRQGFGQSILEEEIGIDDNSCALCGMEKLFFAPVPIYCLSCGKLIKRNANFYQRRAEEIDTEQCFCTPCFRNSRGESIQFNGVSIPKKVLDCKKNDYVTEEAWVQCDKCQRWQHQICALFNDKRNSEGKFQYVCPKCCSKEIEEGIRTPLGTAIFGAKDLPRTKLSDHVEQRLFLCLEHERAHKAKVEGKNIEEISGAENLTVRVVLSVEKQLKVKKEFLDVLSEESYSPEFPYTSKVILLFQNIEGVDVCIYVVFVQEFGSECSHPNHRCVYISYIDSVKHFRPQRETVTGEALRTFVYHEILIGYLEFCKKRGFEKCYIWACPPLKGEDYVLYCHPQSQKTPKSDKLRRWYHSMLRKATKEDIVVGLTNIYDQFFVSAEKCNSKVTAARLPYFDGDYWSGAVMNEIKKIEQESKGEYDKKLKQVLTKRALKSMGHTDPSKDTAKDILVMHKLGQTILPVKEDFIIVQLQYTCTLCHKAILSGKRWFCAECRKYQQCERCRTSDTHTSINGEKHTLCQAVVDDIPCDTKENDIALDNDLFENRINFLSFCQQNQLQFDTLRHAKHSSMILLYHLKSSALRNVDSRCSICRKDNVSQLSWKCDICPQLSVCSTCYEEKGAACHQHKLRQYPSTAHCLPENQRLEQRNGRELLKVLRHTSQCNSTISQPCSYPNCLQIKKLFSHANKCTVKARGGCQHCKKAWTVLSLHSKNCKDSMCRIERCNDMKKYAEWLAQQRKSRRQDAVLGSSARE